MTVKMVIIQQEGTAALAITVVPKVARASLWTVEKYTF